MGDKGRETGQREYALMKAFLYRCAIAVWNRLPGQLHLARILKGLDLVPHRLRQDLRFSGGFSLDFQGTQIRFYASHDDGSAQHLFWNGLDGGWDATSLRVWATLARESSVVLDIGSNIGHYALVAKKVNPDAEVFAFEPSRRAFEALCRNVALNATPIHTANIALSDVTGTATFHDLHVLTAAGSLVSDADFKDHPQANSYEVQVQTLAAYAASNAISAIDLVSIDVERHEGAVIRGMGDLLHRHRPNVVLEILNEQIGDEVMPLFDGLEYSFYWIDELRGLVPTSALRRPRQSANSYNFLVCRKASVGDVQSLLVRDGP